MKKVIVIIAIIIFNLTINVKAYITCNDGTESKTCMDCHQGCCCGHKGCLKEKQKVNRDYLKYIAIGAGTAGAATAGYIYGSTKNKKNK